MDKIDLKGLDKAAVLAALYNASKPQGMGFMNYDSTPMTVKQAGELLKRQTNFDYLQGRVMKIDLAGDELDTWGYDRDNGEGAAKQAISALKATGDVNAEPIAKTHKDNTFLSAVSVESTLKSVSGLISDPSEPVAVFRLGYDEFGEKLAPIVNKAKLDNMNDNEPVSLFCMCQSFDCALEVKVPMSEAQEVLSDENKVVIVDGCPNGSGPIDKIVEKRKGYTLYKES